MTDIFLPKKSIIIDSQILSGLQACGRMSDFRFNHSFAPLGGKSNSLEVGSLVHKVLEVYNKVQIQGLSKSEAINYALVAGDMYIRGCEFCTNFKPHSCDRCSGTGFLQSIDDNSSTIDVNCLYCDKGQIKKPECNHEVDEYPGMIVTPQVPDKTHPKEKYMVGWEWALKTCEQYFDYYKNDAWTPLEVEVTKGEVLYEDDEIRILYKGKMDRIVDTNGQGVYPVDVKTFKQRRDTVSLNNQFMGYCVLQKTRKMIIDKVGFQTTLPPKEKFDRVIVGYSSSRLLEWQSVTLPFWGKMYLMYQETGHWPENYTHCENKFGFCTYKAVCESDPEMREEVLRTEFKVGKKWDIVEED